MIPVFLPGQRVKVFQKIQPKDWDNEWIENMDKYIGKIGTVLKDHGNLGIDLAFQEGRADFARFYVFPQESLTLDLNSDGNDKLNAIETTSGINEYIKESLF